MNDQKTQIQSLVRAKCINFATLQHWQWTAEHHTTKDSHRYNHEVSSTEDQLSYPTSPGCSSLQVYSAGMLLPL